MRAIVLCAIGALVSAGMVGCQREASVSSVKRKQQDELRRFDQAASLFKAASTQLNDLPAAVDIEVKPPVNILDSRTSADKQDVYAICAANPATPEGPANVIHVPTGNARFKGLGVRPGDVIKYFIVEDLTVDEDTRKAGYSKQKAMELKVAHVVDDNTLLVENGLSQMYPFPAKIEVWRHVSDRLQSIHDKLTDYEIYRKPALAWEPAPDEQVLTQVLAWLNQWIRQSDASGGWKPDPLLKSLPSELAEDKQLAEYISPSALAAKSFTPNDARLLQEAIWLRDIARWARGSSFDDIGRAQALFDWTIRNIELVPDGQATSYRPWHVLAHGRGTADQRAWVFALLCRQQGLNVVMLGIPTVNVAEGKSQADGATYWLPALVSKGQAYLFDPRLGLPVAAADGKGVATLEQVLKDDSLLRNLDLDGAAYPLTAESLKNAKAYIVADPFELSTRAAQVEAALSGDDHVALAVKPSEVASQLKDVPGIGVAGLWELPFSTLRDQLNLPKSARHREALAFEPFAVKPALWKARTRHFQGRRKAADAQSGEGIDDHQEAARLYMSRSVRPTDEQIAAADSADRQRVDTTAKLDATYWLGLLSFDDGKFDVAEHWFGRPDLASKESPWLHGSQYNLGRSLEAQNKVEDAILLFEKDESGQAQGSKLRARELKARPQPPAKDQSGK